MTRDQVECWIARLVWAAMFAFVAFVMWTWGRHLEDQIRADERMRWAKGECYRIGRELPTELQTTQADTREVFIRCKYQGGL